VIKPHSKGNKPEMHMNDHGITMKRGLVRLPVKDKDILLFSNVESPGGRHHGTVWAGFDGGKSWPLKRLVTEGAFAYSALNAGRLGTKSGGWIYLFCECLWSGERMDCGMLYRRSDMS
jgi:hypothetical protein